MASRVTDKVWGLWGQGIEQGQGGGGSFSGKQAQLYQCFNIEMLLTPLKKTPPLDTCAPNSPPGPPENLHNLTAKELVPGSWGGLQDRIEDQTDDGGYRF